MKRKLKIAQVVPMEAAVPPSSQNGLEFVVSWITEELVRRGHEVTLFAPEGSKTQGKLVALLPQEMWSDNSKPWQQPARSMWNTVLVSHHASEFDIIHCHTGTIVYTLPFIKTPVAFTLHHQYADDVWKPYLATPEHREQMKFIVDQYSKINYVAVSKKQEQDFMQAESLYFKNHTCIHNGIPVEHFEFAETPKDYLFYIGYINENKGADIAVQVARSLDMKLILAGNVYGQEDFFKQKIEPFLDEKITYVGPVNSEEKVKLYKNALATLAPLRWDEPFGLTLAESQACGTPVIAFNKGAAPEIVKHGVTGFIVDTADEMKQAIQNIHTIKREDCRTWVKEKFSIKRMVDDYEALYEKIIG